MGILDEPTDSPNKQKRLAERKHKSHRTQAELLAKACEHLLANPQATNSEVMYFAGCSARTAAMARVKLRSEGHDIVAYGDRVRAKAKAVEAQQLEDAAKVAEEPDLIVENAGDLIAAINDEVGGELSEDAKPEEMRKILTVILRNRALDPRVRVLAIAQKAKLDFETQDRDSLGPGKPLTREDAVTRLSTLIEACGLDILEASIARIHKQKEQNAELQTLPELPPAEAESDGR